jgi:hypothetical protein
MAGQERASDEEPTTGELEEPSTEKEPEEPKAPRPHDPEPDHAAVGIGVEGDPEDVEP